MSRCLPVKLKDGSTVTANVGDGVTKLPQSDIDALEQFVAYVKAKHAKKRKAAPSKQGEKPK